MASVTIAERVRALVADPLARSGIELVDVEHKGATLRVFVDRPGGIDLDTIAAATEVVSALLDAADPIPGRYVLEVSSPGLERPLRTPAQFKRAVGARVSVRTHPSVEGERRIEGTLTAADDHGIVVDGRPLAYADIERARTVFVWGAAPKPGRAPGKKAT